MTVAPYRKYGGLPAIFVKRFEEAVAVALYRNNYGGLSEIFVKSALRKKWLLHCIENMVDNPQSS